MSDAIRLQTLVAEGRFETIDIDRASVIEVRDVPPDHPLWNAAARSGLACFVVTKNRSYVVAGMNREIASKLWPGPEVCPTCKRVK